MISPRPGGRARFLFLWSLERNDQTRFEFRGLIEGHAALHLMPDICHANGFSETMRIARPAAAFQLQFRLA